MANVKYRKVKRKAAVGERIKIVNPRLAVGYGYGDSGDVVSLIGDEGARAMLNGELRTLFNNEYVVLEPVANASTPQEPDALAAAFRQFVLDNADAIRAILPDLPGVFTTNFLTVDSAGSVKATGGSVSKPLTRAEVIAKATADVAELLRIGRSIAASLPAGQFREKFYTAEFHVNRDKRTVVALVSTTNIHGHVLRKNVAKATAKAAPDDVFHAEIGKAIALRRALGLAVPNDYVNAPQPEKADVGAKIRISGGAGILYTVTEHVVDARDRLCKNYVNITLPQLKRSVTIIDDTDADYSVNAGNAESTQSSAA